MASLDESIIELQCTPENKEKIDHLTECAESQHLRTTAAGKPDFQVLYPWQSKCNAQDYLFINYQENETCPIILGWMKVTIREFNRGLRKTKPIKIAHVNYIATNQNSPVKGVGTRMMEFMQQSMREKECHFVELMPLSDERLIRFYRDRLGYQLEFDDLNYYILWFVDKQTIHKELQLYKYQLDIENKKVQKEIEEGEREAFQHIYEQLDEEEQATYKQQQRVDDFTRISLVFVYEEAEEQEEGSGIIEVKKMLH
jgi:catechol 2,3-dioxygenase-like lactoylglutathione lyase family enzyme